MLLKSWNSQFIALLVMTAISEFLRRCLRTVYNLSSVYHYAFFYDSYSLLPPTIILLLQNPFYSSCHTSDTICKMISFVQFKSNRDILCFIQCSPVQFLIHCINSPTPDLPHSPIFRPVSQIS